MLAPGERPGLPGTDLGPRRLGEAKQVVGGAASVGGQPVVSGAQVPTEVSDDDCVTIRGLLALDLPVELQNSMDST